MTRYHGFMPPGLPPFHGQPGHFGPPEPERHFNPPNRPEPFRPPEGWQGRPVPEGWFRPYPPGIGCNFVPEAGWSRGQLAYEAYAAAAGGLWPDGSMMPVWPGPDAAAWEAVAEALSRPLL